MGVPQDLPAFRFLELTRDLAAVADLDGRIIRANAAFADAVGLSTEALAGADWRRFIHPDDAAQATTGAQRMSRGGRSDSRGELRMGSDERGWRWYLLSVAVDREEGVFFGLAHDVTDRREAEARVAEAEARFRSSFETAAIGMSITSVDGHFLRVNRALCAMVGRDEDDLVGRDIRSITHPDDRDADADAIAAMLAGATDSFATEKRYLRPDGSTVWIALSASLVRDDERPRYFISQMTDITRRVAALNALAAREAEFRLLAENSSDFLSRHAPDGAYMYASPACEALMGYAPAELIGRSPYEFIHSDDRLSVVGAHTGSLADGQPATLAYRVLHKDGTVRWCESTLRAVQGADGEILEVVAVTRDISERKQAELELSHAALHDALTGLPNRALFLDRLGLALLRAERRAGHVAVLFCDLDRFKVVNDSLGHAAGDRLLIDVTARLSAALRPSDTVARFGGDEFTILAEDLSGEVEAATIAQRIVDAFAEPFTLNDGEVFLAVSVGVAIAQGRGDEPADLIRDADAAMYRAKEQGKARFAVFTEAMRADAVERLETESALRRAVERGELRLHYQPEIDVVDGSVVGFEALLRWQHPERGLLAPAEFIPLAEETGLIVPIGEWVLREACTEARGWRPGRDGRPLMLAVNLSARQLAQADLTATVRRILAETGTEPTTLCLEITESAVMESGAATTAQLRTLKALGVKLAIDDFGTGYSSLVHLRRFPVDVLKIDRTFVDGLGREAQDASIAAAVISLAHALGLSTVAEGIETQEQLGVLTALGCDLGQGFLFARPQPPAAAAALVGRSLTTG